MTQALEGFISTYWAQGMEEEAWLIFQDRAHVELRPDGSEAWAMEGMWRVESGAQLTILGPDEAVLWSGTLATRRTGLLGLLGETTLAPPGIEPAAWRAWFERTPPLAARYLPPAGGGG